MKASIRPKVTERQRDAIKKLAHEQTLKEISGITRRNYKLIMIALNEAFGFGAGRMSNLLAKVEELAAVADTDEVFWAHVDGRLQQMGLDFEPEKEE